MGSLSISFGFWVRLVIRLCLRFIVFPVEIRVTPNMSSPWVKFDESYNLGILHCSRHPLHRRTMSWSNIHCMLPFFLKRIYGMKLQILRAPTDCATPLPTSFLHTLFCIAIVISQHLLYDAFPTTRPMAGLEANHHQIRHGLTHLIRYLRHQTSVVDLPLY